MQRILGGIVPANLEMEMRPAYPSRAPDSRHDLTSNHTLPFSHQVGFVMGIDRDNPARVAQNHHISVAAQLIAVDNLSGFNRQDGRAFRRGDVYAVMEARAPRSKSRVDRPVYRPEKCLEPRLW